MQRTSEVSRPIGRAGAADEPGDTRAHCCYACIDVMDAPRTADDAMRCRACGASDQPFPPGIIGIELCLLCSNDLREYCRSFGEDVSHKRREAWLRMVSRQGTAGRPAGLLAGERWSAGD